MLVNSEYSVKLFENKKPHPKTGFNEKEKNDISLSDASQISRRNVHHWVRLQPENVIVYPLRSAAATPEPPTPEVKSNPFG
jgi:hypothetical protein